MTAFQTFLSYNSEDSDLVKPLFEALIKEGISTWFDQQQIAPGDNTVSKMTEGLKQSESVLVCVGENGLGQWQEQEIYISIKQSVETGKRVIPIILPGATADDLPLFLGLRHWLDLSSGLNDQLLDFIVWGITGERGNELIGEISGFSALLGYTENAAAAEMVVRLEPAKFNQIEGGEVIDQFIDQQLLEVMIGNIRKAKDRLAEALQDPANTSQAKDAEMAVAKSSICSELSRVRQLNANELPGKDLTAAWTSFGCQ